MNLDNPFKWLKLVYYGINFSQIMLFKQCLTPLQNQAGAFRP